MTLPTDPARVGTGGRTCNRPTALHQRHRTVKGSRRSP